MLKKKKRCSTHYGSVVVVFVFVFYKLEIALFCFTSLRKGGFTSAQYIMHIVDNCKIDVIAHNYEQDFLNQTEFIGEGLKEKYCCLIYMFVFVAHWI